MDLRPYVENLRGEFAAADDLGGAEASAQAERHFTQLEAAIRLTLLDVLSAAADEITRELAPGSVHVRLSGREPAFVVTPAHAVFAGPDQAARAAASPAPVLPPEGDDGGTSRINLRLPDHLKASVESAAAQAGLSVNAWLVRAIGTVIESADRDHGRGWRGQATQGQHFTGWVR